MKQITYTVKYKHRLRLFWRTIRNVTADGVADGMPHRYFVRDDGSRVEIPFMHCRFKFGKERDQIIREQMEAMK